MILILRENVIKSSVAKLILDFYNCFVTYVIRYHYMYDRGVWTNGDEFKCYVFSFV